MDQLEPARPYNFDYHSEAPTDPPWNYTPARKSESGNYGIDYRSHSEHGAISDPRVSEKVVSRGHSSVLHFAE